MKGKTTSFFLLISLSIIVYLTLYPFNFLGNFREIELKIFLLHPEKHSLSDIFSNFLLFFPIGFFWFYATKTYRKWISLAMLFFFAAIFSFTLEFFQQFLPERISSLTDVATNTLGAVAGFLAAPFLSLPRKSRFSLDEYFALFMVFYLLAEPFIPSLDIGDLKYKLKHISFSPGLNNVFLSSFFMAYAFKRFSWASLGFFWLLIEGFRYLVVGIVLNPIKSFLRLILAFLFKSFIKQKDFYVWAFAICYLLEAWAPFSFRHPSFKIDALIPFKYFYDNVSFGAIFSLFRELFCFVFWGLIQGSIGGAFLLSLVAEVGQLFIVGRYADATTIFLAILGTLLGRSLLASSKDVKLQKKSAEVPFV